MDIEQTPTTSDSATNEFPRQRVGVAQAETFLVAHLGPDVSGVAPIGQGQWSTAYAFQRGEAEYVVRFGAHGEDFAKDLLAARYGAPNLPIPAITEIGEAFGEYYAISRRATGRFLDELDAREMRELLPSLFAMFDAARTADVSRTTGYGMWGADGWAPFPSWRAALLDVANDHPTDRTYGWRAALRMSTAGDGPFEEAFARLHSLVEHCPEERHLVHSDLLNRNVLVEDGRISAVLDWGCALYGDFLYDLAWIIYWQPWYPAWSGINFRVEAAQHYEAIGLEVPHFDERLRCCLVHIGLGAQAYNAYKGDERAAALEATSRRTLDFALTGW